MLFCGRRIDKAVESRVAETTENSEDIWNSLRRIEVVHHYFLRIGSLGEIRLASALIPLHRGRRVVVRTPRGVEIAEVASTCRFVESASGGQEVAFRVLRPTSDSDELLVQRLEQHKSEAIQLCRDRLGEIGCAATLLDVDQLLDGGTLVMHFLGDVDSQAKQIADEIAKQYESVVRSDHLSELLNEGCGPSCGTEEGSGCGTGGGCSGCSGCK